MINSTYLPLLLHKHMEISFGMFRFFFVASAIFDGSLLRDPPKLLSINCEHILYREVAASVDELKVRAQILSEATLFIGAMASV